MGAHFKLVDKEHFFLHVTTRCNFFQNMSAEDAICGREEVADSHTSAVSVLAV